MSSTSDLGLFPQEVFTSALTNLVDIGGGVYTVALSRTPYSEDSVKVFINGNMQRATTDYTIASNVVTLTPSAEFIFAEAVIVVVYVGTV